MSQGRSFYSQKLSFHSYMFQTRHTKCSTLQSLPTELRVFIHDLPEIEVNFCPLMGVRVQNIFTTSTSILNKSDAWRTRLNSGMLLRKRKFLQKVWLTFFLCSCGINLRLHVSLQSSSLEAGTLPRTRHTCTSDET